MRVCGVICEYNPFHRGHALHLARAREASDADYVVCVMSGPVTQRGAFARNDKWTRARAALMGGADLVLELPARFACAPAPDFARGAVALLSSLGVVTHLSFGCEPEALPLLGPAARALAEEGPAFRAALREALSRGASFPHAQAAALKAVCSQPGLAGLLDRPNAALALEYLRALPESIAPVPISREGGGYHGRALGPLASASAVRAAMERGDLAGARASLPFPAPFEEAEARGDFHAPEALDLALLYRLRSMTPQALAQVPGMDEGLEHRFLTAARETASREALLERVKTRRYTHARLSRLCTLALLGVTRSFCEAHRVPSYARILGFRREAALLLRAVKAEGTLPLVTRPAAYDRNDPLYALDLRAQDLWSLGCAAPALRACGRDLTHNPVIL